MLKVRLVLILILFLSLGKANSVNEVSSTGYGKITNIKHTINTTEITLFSKGSFHIYTGGNSIFRLNGNVFKYFKANGKKFYYTNDNPKKISFYSTNITFVFDKLSDETFNLIECEDNDCWNFYNVNSRLNANSINQLYNSGNQDFNSAINQFQQSGNKTDLKKVYKLAKTRTEKLKAERLLFQNLDLSKIFNIKLVSSSSSTEKYNNIVKKTIPLLGSQSDISMQIKTLKKEFELEPKISLIGNYKVKIDFSLEIGTNVKSNLVPSRDSGFVGNILNQLVEQTVIFDTRKYTAIFYINNNNGHKDTKIVDFKVQSVGTSALGVDAKLNIVSMNLKTSITSVE